MESLSRTFVVRNHQSGSSLWYQDWATAIGWVWLAGEKRWLSEREYHFVQLPNTSLVADLLSGLEGLDLVSEEQACSMFPTAFDAVQPWVKPLGRAAVNY